MTALLSPLREEVAMALGPIEDLLTYRLRQTHTRSMGTGASPDDSRNRPIRWVMFWLLCLNVMLFL